MKTSETSKNNLPHKLPKNNDRAEYFQCDCRYYEGEFPILVVSDPEIVKQIAIKDFHKFHSRKVTN